MNRLATLVHSALSGSGPDPRPSFSESLQRWYGGRPDVHLFWKGRVALHAICRALGLGPGHEVLVAGYTCVVVPEAFLSLGARPVFVDIDPATYNVAADRLVDAVTDKTRLVIVQHTYGIPGPLTAALEYCRPRGIAVVEDACHAFGTRVDGALAGTRSDAAFLSGQWNKPFSTGLGGILLVNDPALAQRVHAILPARLEPTRREETQLSALLMAHEALVGPRTYGWAQTAYRVLSERGLLIGSSSREELAGHLPPDYFKGMGRSQAVAGNFESRHFQESIDHRVSLARLYDHLLAEAGFEPAPGTPGTVSLRYPVRVANKASLVRRALRVGIELGTWFESPLHPLPLDRHASFGYEPGQCPHAEAAAQEVINLPVSAKTDEGAARRVVRFLARHGVPRVGSRHESS